MKRPVAQKTFPALVKLGVALVLSTLSTAAAEAQPAPGCSLSRGSHAMPDESLDDARRAIRRTLHEWKQAIAAGDPEALSRLVTEDAEFWSQERPPLVGPSAVAAAFATLFESYSTEQRFECDELVVAGSWAFLRGTEVNHLRPNDGGPALEVRQRAFSVLRRSDDGGWLFARGMTHRPPLPEEPE